jgi:hypothetical protein
MIIGGCRPQSAQPFTLNQVAEVADPRFIRGNLIAKVNATKFRIVALS